MDLGNLDAKLLGEIFLGHFIIDGPGWYPLKPLININITKSRTERYYVPSDVTCSTTFEMFLPKNLNLNLVQSQI